MAIQPTQPQSIGGVLDTTFQLYTASVGKVWVLCILGAIASALPSIYMALNGAGNPADPTATLAMISSPGYWLVSLAAIVLSSWSMAAVYLKVHAVGTDDELSLGQALGAALRRTPVLVLSVILFVVAMMIGLVLLVVPGVILMVSLILFFNLVLFEDKGPIAALTGSHRLVWGDWWRTLATLLVVFILIFVIYLAIGFAVGVAIPLFGLGADDPLMLVMVTSVVLGFFASLVITPFYVAVAVALYWDLKLRKEGGDLAARVGALGTT